ncbi:MAG: hypothetical protein AVDCRST_MAG59-2180, partial [uncultured Thermomicrobiales bacterium]
EAAALDTPCPGGPGRPRHRAGRGGANGRGSGTLGHGPAATCGADAPVRRRSFGLPDVAPGGGRGDAGGVGGRHGLQDLADRQVPREGGAM